MKVRLHPKALFNYDRPWYVRILFAFCSHKLALAALGP